ncbi:MAG: hypothetical protein AAFO07_17105 [Bacteroidota bacterium]
METIVNIKLMVFGIYLLLGVVFSLLFLLRGVNKIDEGAVGTSIFFKLLILPGVIALWPTLLYKWVKSGSQN